MVDGKSRVKSEMSCVEQTIYDVDIVYTPTISQLPYSGIYRLFKDLERGTLHSTRKQLKPKGVAGLLTRSKHFLYKPDRAQVIKLQLEYTGTGNIDRTSENVITYMYISVYS